MINVNKMLITVIKNTDFCEIKLKLHNRLYLCRLTERCQMTIEILTDTLKFLKKLANQSNQHLFLWNIKNPDICHLNKFCWKQICPD